MRIAASPYPSTRGCQSTHRIGPESYRDGPTSRELPKKRANPARAYSVSVGIVSFSTISPSTTVAIVINGWAW